MKLNTKYAERDVNDGHNTNMVARRKSLQYVTLIQT